ncbi:UDP-3-O-(3-hydroxymyristoyl) glucosamine N-acyltransferase [Candidatus Endolissoclinum faulkneri L2]|uniref:UDP-3-O-acylglucosamine N-acyltransferase n=1 Tax=Candidatus Endolissoclinum faulkneri L2 TaxID=1193729 RepID=K7YND2_9PROT|nr:UDP-3-O-(3-hydroxymyristoyl)glucosamine N-acyltransferase [Candidatus Endolissoclinum faulkneri]AFX99007.1 UDP-3-O-(3-hydroxymyristoyl) glucosamine N-acyltransferase [Candidatus Endolissoclinum faulkneri L2]
MVDSRFHSEAGQFTLEQILEMTGAKLHGSGDLARLFYGVSTLNNGGEKEVTFLENRRYLKDFRTSKAGACLVPPAFANQAPDGMAVLITAIPRRSYAKLARLFHPAEIAPIGVHPTAVVDPTARLGNQVAIGPGAVIGAEAVLGDSAWIEANAVIGEAVRIGEGTRIGVGAVVSHALIGARCFIYPGARIGQPGFGFEMDAGGTFLIPQLGRAIIEDDVEVGANTAIDRGSNADTVIGQGSMIDNLVQIGHNVVLGRGCIVVSQVGISGSTRLGDRVVIAGKVGIAGHLEIGSDVQVAAMSGVNRSLPGGGSYGGVPAIPVRKWRRQISRLKKLGQNKPTA